MPFKLVEPHPSIPRNPNKKTHLSTGRGGAGNFSSHRPASLTEGPTASGPASRLSMPSPKAPQTAAPRTAPPKSKYSSGGIGGAGNFVPTSERRLFSFDEELEREQRMEQARTSTPVVHFGRGGAGNLAATRARGSASSGSSAASSAASTTSATSSEAAAARLGSRFGKMVRALSSGRE